MDLFEPPRREELCDILLDDSFVFSTMLTALYSIDFIGVRYFLADLSLIKGSFCCYFLMLEILPFSPVKRFDSIKYRFIFYIKCKRNHSLKQLNSNSIITIYRIKMKRIHIIIIDKFGNFLIRASVLINTMINTKMLKY